jgi:hypothetical protein
MFRSFVSFKAGVLVLAIVLLFAAGFPAAAEPVTRYVDGDSGEDAGACADPAAPCLTINYAIGESADGDTILVAQGIYPENVKLTDGNARTIIGGHVRTGAFWDPAGEATIIHGRNADTTVEIRNHSDTVIDTVRVIGGMGQDDPTFGNGCGGFKIQNSNVQIINVGIRQNSAGTGDGGGICAAGDDGTIDLLLDKVFVGGNIAVNAGAGLLLENTQTMIINTVFANNRSESRAANVMQLNNDQVTIINSTIANNNRAEGTAIVIIEGKVTMKNSIMWDNDQNLVAPAECEDCFDVTYSDIEQPVEGEGNISADPRFVNRDQRNFRLRRNSPCINAGTADGAPSDDLRFNPRGEYPDMGAFEYEFPDIYMPIVFAS